MNRYAEGTTVAAEKTRAEIETYLKKQGATRFAFGYIEDRAGISFVAKGRMVRFTVPAPAPNDPAIRQRARRVTMAKAIDQEERRRWRCLLLAIKSKFTTVESGIESFDEAFLANIVTHDNMTVWERIQLENSGVRLLEPSKGGQA